MMKCPVWHFIEILQAYSGDFEGVGVFDFLQQLQELGVDQNRVCGQTFLETQGLSVGKAKKGPEEGQTNKLKKWCKNYPWWQIS